MIAHSDDVTPIQLRDGRKVWARQVCNSDADLFVIFFAGLSPTSRNFMRGWNVGTSCTPEHASRLAAEADADDHSALAILDRELPNERIVGYSWIDGIGVDDIPMLGIGVIDEYHGVGLGTILMQLMKEEARSLSIDRMQLGVFADNARAVHVYESAGFRTDPALPPKQFDGRTELYMVVETA